MAVLDEIGGYLGLQGLATSSSGSTWQRVEGWLPDTTALQHKVVALVETAGRPPLAPVELDYPGLQVLVRGDPIPKGGGAAFTGAKAQLDAIFLALHALGSVQLPSSSAATTPFSRATVATYTDITGTLQTAGIDVLRNQNYSSSGLTPPLIEAAGSNAGQWSEATTNWTPGGGAIAITTGYDRAPDGSTNAALLVASSVGSLLYQPTTLLSGSTAVCVTAYLKNGSSASRQVIGIVNSSAGSFAGYGFVTWTTDANPVPSIAPSSAGLVSGIVGGLANGWYRAWIASVGLSSSAAGYKAQFKPDNASSSGQVEFWGMQLEASSAPRSYIATTGAVAAIRAADLDPMLAATTTGYVRQTGSFLTDGFKVGMKITPGGTAFTLPTNTGPHVITAIPDALTLTCGGTAAEAAEGGRSLATGTLRYYVAVTANHQPALLHIDPAQRPVYVLNVTGWRSRT